MQYIYLLLCKLVYNQHTYLFDAYAYGFILIHFKHLDIKVRQVITYCYWKGQQGSTELSLCPLQ